MAFILAPLFNFNLIMLEDTPVELTTASPRAGLRTLETPPAPRLRARNVGDVPARPEWQGHNHRYPETVDVSAHLYPYSPRVSLCWGWF